MNLHDINRSYRRTVRKLSDNATTVLLELDRVRPGWRRVLSHVTVEDKTSAFTKVRLAINRTDVIHYIDELQTVAAAELAVSRSDILLEEHDLFYAELTGTTLNDEIVLTAIGWEQQL